MKLKRQYTLRQTLNQIVNTHKEGKLGAVNSDEHCLYRHRGMRCAIGALLSDYQYRIIRESGNLLSGVDMLIEEKLFNHEDYSLSFAQATVLQDRHDDALVLKNDIEFFVTELKDILDNKTNTNRFINSRVEFNV